MSIKWNVADTGSYPELGQRIKVRLPGSVEEAIYLGNDHYKLYTQKEPVTIFYALWVPHDQ